VFYERVELALRGTLRFAIDVPTLRRELQKNGFCIWDESPRDLQREAANSPSLLREQQRSPAKSETVVSEVAPSPLSPPSLIVTPATTEVAQVAEVAQVTPAPPVAVATPIIKPGPAPSLSTLRTRHLVAWFDIPVRDLDRALQFYSAVLATKLKKEQAGPGVAIALLPHAEGSMGGCLVQNLDAKPSESGPLLYLNTHGRLDEALNAVKKHGGAVVSGRHSIAPYGFRAIVLDSEGNRIALHSM